MELFQAKNQRHLTDNPPKIPKKILICFSHHSITYMNMPLGLELWTKVSATNTCRSSSEMHTAGQWHLFLDVVEFSWRNFSSFGLGDASNLQNPRRIPFLPWGGFTTCRTKCGFTRPPFFYVIPSIIINGSAFHWWTIRLLRSSFWRLLAVCITKRYKFQEMRAKKKHRGGGGKEGGGKEKGSWGMEEM